MVLGPAAYFQPNLPQFFYKTKGADLGQVCPFIVSQATTQSVSIRECLRVSFMVT
ncbi:hypothetical protein QF010_004858 [Pseudomonas silensiensis]